MIDFIDNVLLQTYYWIILSNKVTKHFYCFQLLLLNRIDQIGVGRSDKKNIALAALIRNVINI